METSHGPSFECANSSFPEFPNFPRYGCDSPFNLLIGGLIAMKNVNPNPDAIVLIGDLSVHDTPTLDQLNKTWDAALDTFRQYFPAPVKIFLTLGNNDAYQDYDLNPNTTASDWLNVLAEKMDRYKIDYNRDTWAKAGYTSTEITIGSQVVKFIGLNTIFYSRKNPFIVPPYRLNSKNIDHVLNPMTFNKKLFKMYSSSKSLFTAATPKPDAYLPAGGIVDPAGQFELLNSDLQDCAKNNKRPYIFGHIPPMYFDFFLIIFT